MTNDQEFWRIPLPLLPEDFLSLAGRHGQPNRLGSQGPHFVAGGDLALTGFADHAKRASMWLRVFGGDKLQFAVLGFSVQRQRFG